MPEELRPDPKARIMALAEMMDEFGLEQASFEEGPFRIAFNRKPKGSFELVGSESASASSDEDTFDLEPLAAPVAIVQTGTPISSPMTGIYYNAPSPGAPVFVKEGDTVIAGAVIGLIEAMKVFNEIHCTVSGTVLKVSAKAGDVVNPGDPLVYVG